MHFNVPMKVKVNYCTGHAPDVSLTTDTVISVAGRRFGIGAVPRGFSGRKVTDGPLVPGPWAYTYGLATVIDNYPERRAAERARDIEVMDEDKLEIDGVWYKVHCTRFGYVDLLPCDPPPPPAPLHGTLTIADHKAKHAYEVVSTANVYTGKPRDSIGRGVDHLTIRVDANNRTSAAAKCKRMGYRVDSVNMIG